MCDERIKTKNMSHEEWLKIRKQGIGGSDAGAICGVNPYKSAIAVYQDKVSEEIEEWDNEAMKQGRDLEQYVAQRFMEATSMKVRKSNMIIKHPNHSFLYANVDRLIIGKNEGLECKTASPYSLEQWKEAVPPSYQIQCYHYMAVTGADAWYIAVLILGREFKYVKIERDEEIIQNLIQIESDFWFQHVVPRIMPEPDGSDSAEELIRSYFKQATNNSVMKLNGFDKQLQRRQEIVSLVDKLSMEKNKIEQQIKLYMEDVELAVNANYRISWKNTDSTRIDATRLKQEMPDVYEKFSKNISSRRFLVKAV